MVSAQFGLDTMQQGWYVGCALVGSIAGVACAGILSDYAGRRNAMLVSAVLFTASAVGCSLADSFDWLVAYRIIGGIGIGVVSIVSPLYISEVSVARYRGSLVSAYQLAITVGFLGAYLANYMLLQLAPGFAGSSAYYLRYMDPHNGDALVSREANAYWRNVDLYIGGTEHATGHLIYSRFWNKFLYDTGVVVEDEPFRKLINQGMIQGRSNFVYRIKDTNTFVSHDLKDAYDTTPIHVDVNIVSNDVLDTDAFRAWRPDYADAEFVLNAEGKYICGWAVEKMSKSMFNVVNPDDIVERYGADTLRLYEMFLGPLEQSKPWDTNGIDGVNRFLKKFWGLYFKGDTLLVDGSEPTADNLRSLHKLIKKVGADIENFSFNTSVAAFMICVNELSQQKCTSRAVLEQLVVVLAPFAPHIAEELWHTALGHDSSIVDAAWPEVNEEYLRESSVNYAVSFNGKARFNIQMPVDADADTVQAAAHESAARWLDGKTVRKVIVVPGKIVNIVVG